MVDINTTVSITTLNVSDLSAPIKTQTLSKCIKIQGATIWCLQETHFNYKDTYRLEENG